MARRENPVCGDVCTLHLRIAADDLVSELRFTGAGCALSQASASLLTAAIAGRSVATARALAAEVESLVRTGDTAPAAALISRAELGDLAALAAAHAYPARHACALLAWQACIAALDAPPLSSTS